MEKEASTEKITPEQGDALILLARRTILEKFGESPEDQKYKDLDDRLSEEAFKQCCGIFVTLKIENNLRGCIGNLTSSEPIFQGVKTNAINAAFHDPRFRSLAHEEIDKVLIEVSVLSKPMELIYSDATDLVEKLQVGVDGLILKKGYASATFLPQVWEQLSTPETFLSNLSMKAGLDKDAWRHTKLEIFTYQVQYFEEEK